jgi:hypothetical protein
MAERQRNRAVVFTEGSAEPTRDSMGNPTVTVRGTFSQEGYSQTSTLHLSYPASLLMFEELREALAL